MKKGHNFIYNYALSDRGISANQQLNALKLALTSQGTPPQLYSLNGYAEDRVCLDQQDHKLSTLELGVKKQIVAYLIQKMTLA